MHNCTGHYSAENPLVRGTDVFCRRSSMHDVDDSSCSVNERITVNAIAYSTTISPQVTVQSVAESTLARVGLHRRSREVTSSLGWHCIPLASRIVSLLPVQDPSTISTRAHTNTHVCTHTVCSRHLLFVYYLRQGGYVFAVLCLSVCLSVC